MHPVNLALRIFLEIAALGGFGALAWRLSVGWWRYLAVIAVLALLMTLWSVFAVPGDPSRSGRPSSGSRLGAPCIGIGGSSWWLMCFLLGWTQPRGHRAGRFGADPLRFVGRKNCVAAATVKPPLLKRKHRSSTFKACYHLVWRA